ncbi:MAG: hypothetical protein IJS56_00560 [Bacilli bacterium]|nr:hypothetical protein [Bacilli bacterium]
MKEENTNTELNQTLASEAPVEMPTPVAPVESAPVEMPAPATPETPAPVESPAPVEPTIASPDVQVASMSNLAPVTETPAETQVPTEGQTAEEIAQGIQDGSMVNAVSDPNAMIGAKVGNTSDDTDNINKKKSKKNITILIVVLVILAIIGGVACYVYNLEYKTANKRVDTLFNKMNGFVLPLISDVEKRMGDYEVTGNATVDEKKASIHMTGNYAYNLEDYIYLDTKIDKITLGEDLLDKTPIEGSIYLADNAAYLKVEEVFPNYITTEVDGLSDIMNSIKQNDIDYPLYYTSVMNALKVSLKNHAVSQTVSKTNITGKSQQANVVTISINKNNYKAIVETFTNTLASNDKLMEDIAKLSGENKEDIIKSLKSIKEDEDLTINSDIKINFYTSLFGKDIIGIDVIISADNSTNKLIMLPVENKEWKFTAYEGNDKLTEFTIGFNLTQESGKKSYVTTFKGDFSYDDFENKKHVIKADFNFTYNINVQYQEDKPVTRGAVNVNNLTEQDFLTIYNNITTKYGILGTYLEDYMESAFTPNSSDYSDYGQEDVMSALCSMATDCNCTGATCECTVTYGGQTGTVTCPANN